MRLSIIALASFIICAVFASPITYGRRSNNDLALSRRGPTTKPAPKPAPKTGKKPAAGKSCSIKKRANEEIVKAVDMAIEKSKSGRGAGRGAGKVYPLTFANEPAVIKIVGPKQTESEVKKEVKNLVGVKQYLAWAIKEGKDGKKQYFIIMKKMGETQKEWIEKDPSLKPAVFLKLRETAVGTYEKEFGAENKDANVQTDNNFVYRKVGDKLVGEIIDWEIGTVEGNHALPAAEIIKESC